ncbi:hypothetical protein ACFOW4_19510 [Micromonospora sp. GCM10011542]|uniref:hypothetical protein n=1 Tax=Micromonospora sp. GCM10011542 TaxID=3317337 RepID=UPI00362467D8
MSSVVAPPGRDAIVVPLPRVRVKLLVFAALTVVAAAAGLPGRLVVALALTSLAIPLAVLVAGGGRAARELLFPVRGNSPDSGLGHRPEQGERFVT